MAVDIYNLSRLVHADLVTVDGVEFWDLPRLPGIPNATDDLLYEVTDSDRPDLLAQKRYGDSRLWDILAQVNDWNLPILDLKSGDIIRMPSAARVTTKLRLSKQG